MELVSCFMRPQRLGWLIVVVSVLVLALLGWYKIYSDNQNLKACQSFCGEQGSMTCTLQLCKQYQGDTGSWIVGVVSVLIAFVGGIGFYLAFVKAEKFIKEKEYDLTKLNEKEKGIFLFIKENVEGVYQSEIVKRFELSKVKVTRILHKLEQMDYIERKRRGMTNIVVAK